MSNLIYLVTDDSTLSPMQETPYDNEDIFQALLEDYPALLAGEQFDSEEPRRWLLVKREMGIPDGEDRGDRWSIDHVFLDQDGVPTLVEVKRAEDTRARRLVVAQMLDDAANAVVFWPVDRMRTEFEETCKSTGLNPDDELLKHLHVSEVEEQNRTDYVESFWQDVKTNLTANKLRLVFVADTIHNELRQIVEFLNRQMDPCEVIAIELKQYISDNGAFKVMVPKVIGQTVESHNRKRGSVSSKGTDWDQDSFFSQFATRHSPDDVEVMKKIVNHYLKKDYEYYWGINTTKPSFLTQFECKNTGSIVVPISIVLSGSIIVKFDCLSRFAPFDNSQALEDLRQKYNQFSETEIPKSALNTWACHTTIEYLRETNQVQEYLDHLDWVCDEINSAITT